MKKGNRKALNLRPRTKLVSSGIITLLVAVALMAPTTAYAVTLTEFDNESPTEEVQTYGDAVAKAITNADNEKDGARGDAIKAYFADKPANAEYAPGVADFINEVNKYRADARDGKINGDTTQIDEILKRVIDAKLGPSLSKKTAPTPKTPQ